MSYAWWVKETGRQLKSLTMISQKRELGGKHEQMWRVYTMGMGFRRVRVGVLMGSAGMKTHVGSVHGFVIKTGTLSSK